MIEVLIWFRSQGFSWPLRTGDRVVLREGDRQLEIAGELAMEVLANYFRTVELVRHGANRTAPVRTLPTRTPDILEQRKLARKTRRLLLWLAFIWLVL